ncbi:MAG: hypothetical protein WCP09_02685 [Candidatus Taylorbacteria bacterium]
MNRKPTVDDLSRGFKVSLTIFMVAIIISALISILIGYVRAH